MQENLHLSQGPGKALWLSTSTSDRRFAGVSR